MPCGSRRSGTCTGVALMVGGPPAFSAEDDRLRLQALGQCWFGAMAQTEAKFPGGLVKFVDHPGAGLRELDGARDDQFEHRLEIEGRADGAPDRAQRLKSAPMSGVAASSVSRKAAKVRAIAPISSLPGRGDRHREVAGVEAVAWRRPDGVAAIAIERSTSNVRMAPASTAAETTMRDTRLAAAAPVDRLLARSDRFAGLLRRRLR